MSRPTRCVPLPAGLPMLGVLVLLAAACQPDAPRGEDGTPGAAPVQAGQPGPVALDDVMESGDGYIIGISYPRTVAAHPGLAAALQAYAGEAREELMQALATPEADGGDPTVPGPYDLSLAFVELPATQDVVAVAADGSSYLGGAHGQPLVRRFVWLPREQRMLTAQGLVPAGSGWAAISAYVRERLLADLSLRLDENGVADEERPAAMRGEATMIEAGTAPDPGNFSEFEPIVGADGKLAGLRFVFPPYQVGPYAAGTQSVDVPAAVLLPHVAPAYRDLFSDGG